MNTCRQIKTKIHTRLKINIPETSNYKEKYFFINWTHISFSAAEMDDMLLANTK